MKRWRVTWESDESLPRIDWPHRQTGTRPATRAERRKGVEEDCHLYEATVTAPTAHAAEAAILGCYAADPRGIDPEGEVTATEIA